MYVVINYRSLSIKIENLCRDSQLNAKKLDYSRIYFAVFTVVNFIFLFTVCYSNSGLKFPELPQWAKIVLVVGVNLNPLASLSFLGETLIRMRRAKIKTEY